MIEKVLSAAVLAIVVLTPTYASSITLPSAYGGVSAGPAINGKPSPTLTSSYTSGLDSALAVASAGAAGPSATASANGDLVASAYLQYYFEISGPAAIDVPVVLSGIVGASLGPSSTASADAYSSVEIFDKTAGDAIVLYLWDCVGYGCTPSGNQVAVAGSYTQTVMLASNNQFEIVLTAGVYPNSEDPSTSAIAAADPYISIDPTFAAVNPGYSIVVSPDVSNSPTSSVPEPGTVGMAALVLGIPAILRALSRTKA